MLIKNEMVVDREGLERRLSCDWLKQSRIENTGKRFAKAFLMGDGLTTTILLNSDLLFFLF